MELEQQLRDALRAGSTELHLHGAGPDAARRRAHRRRHRARRGLAAAGVVGLVGAGITAWDHRPTDDTLVSLGGGAEHGDGAPAPELVWRVIDGTVAFSDVHLSTVDGVTYALATAPGPAETDAGDRPVPRAVYRTRDGERWEVATVDGGGNWIADLSERDGVLYAVGTAPGATDADVAFRLGQSRDGGARWEETTLPFELPTPHANVPLSRSSDVQVATAPGATVVAVSERYWPELQDLLATRFGADRLLAAKQSGPDGFVVVDLTDCKGERAPTAVTVGAEGSVPEAKAERADTGGGGGPSTDAAAAKAVSVAGGADATVPPTPDGAPAGGCEPRAVGTLGWADLGLTGPGDLVGRAVLVRRDGGGWEPASLPLTPGDELVGLEATATGFIAVVQAADGGRGSEVWASADGLSWALRSTAPAGAGFLSVSGDRLLATGKAAERLTTSADGGRTWAEVPLSDLVPGGPAGETVVAGSDAGPLGFAVLVVSVGDRKEGGPTAARLLFSQDGVSWSTTELASVGAPAGAWPSQVTVGADHVAVNFGGDVKGTGDAASTVLLATPKS
jgi:hypothetical protein